MEPAWNTYGATREQHASTALTPRRRRARDEVQSPKSRVLSLKSEGLSPSVRWKMRVGTMDFRIAAIALAHDALLLSRNLTDFRKVPGLRVEDWTV